MNYLAVRSVCMRSLNRQRTNLVFSSLYQSSRLLTPAEAAHLERIFEKDGVLRWNADIVLGHCQIGVSLRRLLELMATKYHPKTGSFEEMEIDIEQLFDIFKEQGYIVWVDPKTKSAAVVLKVGATVEDSLKGWSHALLLARDMNSDILGSDGKKQETREHLLKTMKRTLSKHNEAFPTYLTRLQEAGWDLDTAALETQPGTRLAVE